MKNPLRRRTELERLEHELASKRQQRTRLAERLSQAEATVTQARARVAELAPLEAADTQLDVAERDVRAALDRFGTLAAAVSAIDGEIATLEKAHRAEQDRLTREASVATLNKQKDAIAAPLGRLSEVLKELRTAFANAGQYNA